MNLFLKLSLLVALALPLAVLPLRAQYDPKVYDLKKAQDLYDERGFSQSAVISVDGKLAVNNQNGSLAYSYPISSFTSGGHSVDVSLNYCSAVQFTTFKDYNLADRHRGTEYSGWSRFHQNRPAWILGVAGWAVNVIATAPHFHAHPGSRIYNPIIQDFDDADVPWVIDGYDFSGRMRDFGAVAQSEHYQDLIRILRADGSLLELVNLYIKDEINNGNPDTAARLYTGTYFVNEANSHGYGIVEYDPAFMPVPVRDYIADHVPARERHPLYARILRYYPGDGTEAVFRERVAPFGLSAFTDDGNRSGGVWAHPTIFYLESIKSNGGSVVEFQRARHYPKFGGPLGYLDDLTRGRALVTSFTGHEIRFGHNTMIVEALGRTTKITFDTVMRSGTAAAHEVMPYANLGAMSPMVDTYTGYNEGNPQLARSFLGLVTRIVDPQDRVTSFGYQSYTKRYRNAGFPHNNGTVTLSLKNYRLASVTEPTARYAVSYYGARDEIIWKDVAGWDSPMKLNNMVDSVTKYDADGTLLTSDRYLFHDANNLGPASFSEQITTDHIAGQSVHRQFRYLNYTLNNYAPILSPGRHTVLVSTTEHAGDLVRQTQTSYATPATMPSWGSSGNFVVLPVSQVTSVNGIPRSHQEMSYTLDTVRRVWRTDHLASIYGMEILRTVTRTLNPMQPSVALLADTTTYLHLPLLDTTISYRKVGWDKLKSLANFFYLRDTVRHPDVVGRRWEEVMLRAPVAVFDEDEVSEQVQAPPVFGLQERSWRTDANGAVTGTRNVYVSDILDGDQRALRGKRVADSILGSDGRSLLKGTYGYRREWTGELPAWVRTGAGVETRYGYNYSFCDDVPFWEECASPPPIGTVVANDGTSRLDTLAWSPLAYWYGKPTATQQTVRRYDGNGELVADTLRSYTERTYFGQASATVEPNGYLSRYAYDANGRLNVGWLPLDFPGTGVLDTFSYSGAERVDLYGVTHHQRRVDTIHCEKGWDGEQEYVVSTVIPGPVEHTVNHDTLVASLPLTRVPECPPLPPPPSEKSTKPTGSDRQMQQAYERWLPYEEYTGSSGYVGVLSHVIDAASPLKRATRIDSIRFETMITAVDGECVHLEVAIGTIFTRTFVLGCSDPNLPPGDGDPPQGRASKGGSNTSGRSMLAAGIARVAGGYTLVVDLSPIAGQLGSLPDGSTLAIELRVKTPGATVAFINGTNAEDLRPRLNVYGTYKKLWDRADYTVAYQHDDRVLTTTVQGKVDDMWHTSNDLAAHHLSARRSTGRHFFGADYRLKKTERTVIEPDALGVLASRTDVAEQRHTGLGARRVAINADGDSVQTFYDALGRVVETVNPEGEKTTIAYVQGKPSALGLDDEEYYGYCEGTIVSNEIGLRVAQFSDAFGRLRREVQDYGMSQSNLNLTTQYAYDLLGRLVQVTNPMGQVTLYTHDEFGRVRSKTHPDLGTISYAYDDLGNVRFSQDAVQAAAGLLGFSQYDDLNRLTLMGEAYIDEQGECGRYNEDDPGSGGCGDGSRLTDRLDGNRLYVPGEWTTVTANPTLVAPVSAATVPSVADLSGYRVKGCPLEAEPRLDETTAPRGPFIQHPTRMHTPHAGGFPGAPLAAFEDVQSYPEHARIGVHYDRLPLRQGAVWGHFPSWEQWDRLAPTGSVRNLKGREAAVAYRDKASEPFHYAVTSYDERGRVEALLRYNENLGFDAVYYQYNSANQVIALTVADPLRRFTTWYGHDHQGRVDSVWSRLDGPGTGLLASGDDFSRQSFPGYATHGDRVPELVYWYTKTDRVARQSYPSIDVLVEYAYNRRTFLESLRATRNGSPVFWQRLEYDQSGQITAQEYEYGDGGAKRQEYAYDRAQRLSSWELDGVTTGYQYDEVGSRQQMSRSTGVIEPYTYYPGSNRLLSRQRKGLLGNDTTHLYSYNANGAQTRQVRSYDTPWESRILHREEYGYSFRGLMNRASVQTAVDGVMQPLQQWRYRYNAMGEREQKRLYGSAGGVVPAPDSARYPWVYYLLGGNKQQLAVYHGQHLDSLQRECGDGGVNRVYLYAHEYLSYGVNDVAMVLTRASGKQEYKVVDHLGSTRVVLDDNGEEIGSYDREPFGGAIAVRGVKSRKGFIDKEVDRETNTANHGVRQYDAELGVFWSTDALWEKHPSRSPYQYGLNNPLKFIDPSGMDSVQRRLAVLKAEEYLAERTPPPGNDYKNGAKGQPGQQVDCSGLVSSCIKAGGKDDPVLTVKTEPTGVQRIEKGTREITRDQIEPGSIVSFRTPGSWPTHIGLIADVYRDDDGAVTGFNVIHSSGTLKGPGSSQLGETSNGRYEKMLNNSIHGFYKWDDPEIPSALAGKVPTPLP